MLHTGRTILGAGLSRREALARLGALTLGVAAAGCAPATIAGHALYPEAAALDDDAVHRTLCGFVAAVIPDGEAANAEAVVRCFADPALRFAPHRGEFSADLQRRAQQLAGTDRYDRLGIEQRRRIIQDGLDGGAIARKLYGAVFLTQIVYYSGLWNEDGACAWIGYQGAYVFTGYDAITWPDPDRFFPVSLTTDGNPA